MPGLRARYRIVINERNHGDAGQSGNGPADHRPQKEDVRTEFAGGVEKDVILDFAPESDQQRGEGHGDQREDDQAEGYQTLLHEPPDFGKLVTAAKAFHPRDHYAGGGPQGQQRGGNQQANRTLRGAAQVAHRGIAARGKNPRKRVGNLAHEWRALSPGGQHRTNDQQRGEKRENGRVSRRLGNRKGIVLKSTPEGQAQKTEETKHPRN